MTLLFDLRPASSPQSHFKRVPYRPYQLDRPPNSKFVLNSVNIPSVIHQNHRTDPSYLEQEGNVLAFIAYRYNLHSAKSHSLPSCTHVTPPKKEVILQLPLLSVISTAMRTSLPYIPKGTDLILTDLSWVPSPLIKGQSRGIFRVLLKLHSLVQENFLGWGQLDVTWISRYYSHQSFDAVVAWNVPNMAKETLWILFGEILI